MTRVLMLAPGPEWRTVLYGRGLARIALQKSNALRPYIYEAKSSDK